LAPTLERIRHLLTNSSTPAPPNSKPATPYYYSTYEEPYTVNGKPVTEDEIRLTNKPKVIIIGGGPIASARESSSTTAASTPPSQ